MTDETPQEHHAKVVGRIRALMGERSVTDEELVAAVGVDKLALSLQGDRPFSSYEIACVAEFFGVTVMQLITGEDSRAFRIIAACNLDDVFWSEPVVESTLVRDYRNEDGIGYIIESGEAGYRWSWTEAGETDLGEWVPTLPEALRSAASDWEYHGDGGPRDRILRGLATREERRLAKVSEISS